MFITPFNFFYIVFRLHSRKLAFSRLPLKPFLQLTLLLLHSIVCLCFNLEAMLSRRLGRHPACNIQNLGAIFVAVSLNIDRY